MENIHYNVYDILQLEKGTLQWATGEYENVDLMLGIAPDAGQAGWPWNKVEEVMLLDKVFKIYKGQKHDIMTWPIFSLVAIGCCPGNRVIGKRAFMTGLVFDCQVQSKRAGPACQGYFWLVFDCQLQQKWDFLRKCVPKQCTAPRLEHHPWYFGHIMTQKLLPGTVKTINPYTLATGQSTAPRQEPHSCCWL